MKSLYRFTEISFEKLASVAISILGNSITFILALITVLFWWSNKQFYIQDIHESLGDVILGITFLSLFIIQKTFNRFSASLHLKVNELVASHEPASNAVINSEEKTEHELAELSRAYSILVEQVKEEAVETAAAAEEEKDEKPK